MRITHAGRIRWVVAAVAMVAPVAHPLLLQFVGVASHLLWFVQTLAVAIVAYEWGPRMATAAVIGSAASVWLGETSFGNGYGLPADEATRLALMVSVGVTGALVAGFAVVAKAESNRRQEIQMQLLQSQKMEAIGRLAGAVAHDFNNLLTVILSTTHLLLESAPTDDPLWRQDLEAIEGAAHSAARLTGQLLAFSRRQPHDPRALDLNVTLGEMAGMLRRLIGEAVTLTFEPAAKTAPVFADATQMEQVVMNLVVNARDAMPTGGRIAVRTELVELTRTGEVNGLSAGSYVALSVQDTGVGMDAETQARMFEPFFTTKPVGRGTGLGLATVFGIVQQAHGGIAIASRPGAGTRMTVYLPRHAAGSRGDADHTIAEPVRCSGVVLLVDDEPMVLESTRRILARCGYTVVVAPGGAEAVRALDGGVAVDLVLTDVVMPGMGGLELAKHVARFAPALPVLFMSGHAEDLPSMRDLMADGCTFLQKPFDPHTLVAAVQGAIEVARSRRAADGGLVGALALEPALAE